MNEFKVRKRELAVYLFLFILIGAAVNLNIGKDDDIWNVVRNFVPGSVFLFLGLSWKRLSKKMKVAYLIFGIGLLGYMSLHYLVGFHNRHWGN